MRFTSGSVRTLRTAGGWALAVLLASAPVVVRAQGVTDAGAPQSSQASASTSDSATSERDGRYRIGGGDVLDIRIFNRPQLSREAVRVDRRGTIRMPLIEGEVQAACRTERELADEISTRYLKFIKAPQVDVFVREFNSQPVAVIGAVNSPGRFQLQRPVRLLELLTFANGPAERAGRSIQVIHAADSPVCEAPTSASEDALKTGLVSFSLISTLQGREPSNPFVQPGDIITIPEAEQAFIVGNVLRPTAIPLKEPTSISRAVAFAGGTMPDTKNDGVRIIRQLPGSATKTEIHVDLKAIEKRQAEDVLLQANDIVDVPTSGGKRFMRTLLSTIAPAAGQLPVQVIRR